MMNTIQTDIINLLKNYLWQGIIFATIFSSIILLGYIIYLKNQKRPFKVILKRKYLYKAGMWYLFLLYCYMLIATTFLSRSEARIAKMNLKLFSTFGSYGVCQVYMYENIIMFVPYGILVYLLFKKFRKVYWMLGIGFCSSLLIEVIQYITKRGYFQIDDIFNNVLGMVIGYGFGWVLHLLRNKNAS